MANPNPGSVRSGTGAHVSRTAKTGFWPKSGFGAQLAIKIDIDPKNFTIDVTLCVDSESVIRNMVAPRNLEIPFKNRF